MPYKKELANDTERYVANRLRSLGYTVEKQEHNSRCDLIVNGCLRIEVKGSLPNANNGRTRYECLYHNDADCIVWVCRNDTRHTFVIPCYSWNTTKNLAVWQFHPDMYQGKWSVFYDSWNIISDLLSDMSFRYVQSKMNI